ncbi:DsbC family protein [Pseudomonas syringae pv. actinidiae]|nr:DsbC family protein [Pseudomonas syringae pv. actinidiae]
MNIIKKTLMATAIVLISTTAFAQTEKSVTEKIESKAQKVFEGIDIAGITKLSDAVKKAEPDAKELPKSPVLDLYEVKLSSGARVYTDSGANFWVFSRQGLDLLHTPTDSGVININGINDRADTIAAVGALGKTVDFKAKNEKASVTVFFDVNCYYCNKLFNERQSYLDKGITLKFAAAPIFPGSAKEMSKIWCADDYEKKLISYEAYTVDKRTNKNLKAPDLGSESASCSKEIDKQAAVAKKIGLSGTPLLALPNGDKQPGYLSAEDLAKRLGLK